MKAAPPPTPVTWRSRLAGTKYEGVRPKWRFILFCNRLESHSLAYPQIYPRIDAEFQRARAHGGEQTTSPRQSNREPATCRLSLFLLTGKSALAFIKRHLIWTQPISRDVLRPPQSADRRVIFQPRASDARLIRSVQFAISEKELRFTSTTVPSQTQK